MDVIQEGRDSGILLLFFYDSRMFAARDTCPEWCSVLCGGVFQVGTARFIDDF